MSKQNKKQYRAATLADYAKIITDAFGGKVTFACPSYAEIHTEKMAGNSWTVMLAGPTSKNWQDRNDSILANLGI